MSTSPAGTPAVISARTGIRRLILGGRLAPGEQIRQEHLAQVLGLSRSPVREALQSLESEGLVLHLPNRGYFVNRLSAGDLRQIYLMRRLLETELLRTPEWPGKSRIKELRNLNTRMAAAAEREDLEQVVRLNREFHFEIFSCSPLGLLVEEVTRLWNLSEPYRAVYLWEEAARVRIVREHDEMIAAIDVRDAAKLVAVADDHRQAAQRRVLSLLEATW